MMLSWNSELLFFSAFVSRVQMFNNSLSEIKHPDTKITIRRLSFGTPDILKCKPIAASNPHRLPSCQSRLTAANFFLLKPFSRWQYLSSLFNISIHHIRIGSVASICFATKTTET